MASINQTSIKPVGGNKGFSSASFTRIISLSCWLQQKRKSQSCDQMFALIKDFHFDFNFYLFFTAGHKLLLIGDDIE